MPTRFLQLPGLAQIARLLGRGQSQSEPERAPARPPAEVERLTELDGLRGLALLLVIGTHSTAAIYGLYFHGYPISLLDSYLYLALHGGWVGLDLMYVLSGFLITGILLKTKGKPGYFRQFYVRRALRIFPLFYAFLLVRVALQYTNVPWLALNPAECVANFLCLANFWQCYARANEIPFDTGGMIVTWSLAIEGQFYLVWPVVVALASRRWLGRLCVAGVGVAVACRCALTLSHADYWYAYALTPCRMDDLMMGAFVAMAVTGDLPRRTLVRRTWLGLAVGVLALAGVVWANKGPLVHGRVITMFGYTCAGLVFAAILSLVTASQSSGGWPALKVRLLRLVGERGYAIYLFHVPVILVGYDLFRTETVRGVLVPVCEAVGTSVPMYACFFLYVVAASMALAWVSWVVVERPCLGLKRYFPNAGTRMVKPTHSNPGTT